MLFLSSSADFFQKIILENTCYQIVKQFGHSVGPNLGPNCLQRLSADEKLPLARKVNAIQSYAVLHSDHCFSFGVTEGLDTQKIHNKVTILELCTCILSCWLTCKS